MLGFFFVFFSTLKEQFFVNLIFGNVSFLAER